MNEGINVKKRERELHTHNGKMFFFVFINGLIFCSSNELLGWETDRSMHCHLLIASWDDIRLLGRSSWCCSSLNLASAKSVKIRKAGSKPWCPGMLCSECRKWRRDERVIKMHPQVDRFWMEAIEYKAQGRHLLAVPRSHRRISPRWRARPVSECFTAGSFNM